MKAANKEALKESIAVLMKKNKIPGVALALWHNGKRVHLEGYGFTDHQRRMATGVNSVFQLGSISKTLTAWGVMKLVEEKFWIWRLRSILICINGSCPHPALITVKSPFSHS